MDEKISRVRGVRPTIHSSASQTVARGRDLQDPFDPALPDLSPLDVKYAAGMPRVLLSNMTRED